MPHHIEGEEMVDNEKTLKAAVAENIATVLAAALCVGLVAIGTGSLYCLWGLLILVNLNAWRATTKAEHAR